MSTSGSNRPCPRCHQLFDYTQVAVDDTPRLTLDEWTVFSTDSPVSNVPLPQQAEAEICNWLKCITGNLDMMNNPKRLYGKIAFDSLGDLFDFDIKKLDSQMLSLGFSNWMNTLASGEVLLDIVNGLIENTPKEIVRETFPIEGTLPVKRLLHTAPNKSAIYAFLLNHDCLFRDFLDPILAAMRPVEISTKIMTVRDVRQAVKTVQHLGHTLLRSSYTTREWTWKAMMLVVMTLMALTGSLGKGLEKIYSCLTCEPNIPQLAVPELCKAYAALQTSWMFTPSDCQAAIEDMPSSFPYKRVLKTGHVNFKSQLAIEFNLE